MPTSSWARDLASASQRITIFVLLCVTSSSLLATEPNAAMPLEFTTALSAGTLVKVRALGNFAPQAEWNYVVCHGLGGTTQGDRFEQLCQAIKRQQPQANVLLIDWSSVANEKLLGLPNPWGVARQINSVATQAATLLKKLGVEPAQTTAIGESFGTYVIGSVARELGGVEYALAFNPASELGGYTPLDLRQASQRSWSFHTYSPFDTTQEIAHSDFFLETPPQADALAQHTHGIAWLAERVTVADLSWLKLAKAVPAKRDQAFRGQARLSGELCDVAISRVRPVSP